MRLPNLEREQRIHIHKLAAVERGELTNVLGMEYERVTAITAPSKHKLPVAARTSANAIQNSSNQSLFLLDFSSMDGTHILR